MIFGESFRDIFKGTSFGWRRTSVSKQAALSF